MAVCILPGFVTENGDSALCALLEQINAHGAVLFTCEGFVYVPATCPDDPQQGAISLGGAALAKIASIASIANVGVQRDSDRAAFAERWWAESGQCAKDGSIVEKLNVHVGGRLFADDPGPGVISASVRITHGGDIPQYGGTELLTQRGIAKTYRTGTQFGVMAHQNIGAPNPLAGGVMESHLFLGTNAITATDYTLVSLDTDTVGAVALGTIYNPGGWAAVSDIRLKQDVYTKDCGDCLAAVRAIEVFSFVMGGRPFTGFSAQNIRESIPDAVVSQKVSSIPQEGDNPEARNPGNLPYDEVLAVRHGDILAHAVAAIKALDTMLESALARISELEARLATQEKQ